MNTNSPQVLIASVGIGGWYPRGVARLIESLYRESHGMHFVTPWCGEARPPGCPQAAVRDGVDYIGYVAKPFALQHLMRCAPDVAILMDASFFAIKHIMPLVEHIVRTGYYIAPDATRTIGEWASDEALDWFGVSRDTACEIRSYWSSCVGFSYRARYVDLVDAWCDAYRVIPGWHDNVADPGPCRPYYRNPGPVSQDRRCLGHRHDQTTLSLVAHQHGLRDFEKPRFTAYADEKDDDTVLVCQGGL